MLGFYADSAAPTNRYRRLRVTIPGRSDLTVRCRRGYFDALESGNAEEHIRDAIVSPLDANAIPLTASMIPAGAGVELRLTIGVEGLALLPEGDRWKGKVRVVIAQSDDRGAQIAYLDQTMGLNLKQSTRESIMKSGFHVIRPIAVKPRASSIHVVVRDEAGNLGSVILPVRP